MLAHTCVAHKKLPAQGMYIMTHAASVNASIELDTHAVLQYFCFAFGLGPYF
jgi:hypothetical protein